MKLIIDCTNSVYILESNDGNTLLKFNCEFACELSRIQDIKNLDDQVEIIDKSFNLDDFKQSIIDMLIDYGKSDFILNGGDSNDLNEFLEYLSDQMDIPVGGWCGWLTPLFDGFNLKYHNEAINLLYK